MGQDPSAAARENEVVTTLYVCDLDGTLLGPEAAPSAFTVDTVNRLVAQGVPIAIATARSVTSLRRVTEGLDLRGPACVYGGAFVVDLMSGEILTSHLLDAELVDGILDVFADHDASALVYSLDSAPDAERNADTVGWVRGSESEGIRWYLGERGEDPRFRPVASASELAREGTFSIVALAGEAELEPVRGILGARFGDRLTITLQPETYVPGLFWLEIAAPGSDKGAGVTELARLTGADRVVCFGDNRNDLAMFAVADEAYAMANASDEVKAAATAVIGPNDDDGVARWLLRNVATRAA